MRLYIIECFESSFATEIVNGRNVQQDTGKGCCGMILRTVSVNIITFRKIETRQEKEIKVARCKGSYLPGQMGGREKLIFSC